MTDITALGELLIDFTPERMDSGYPVLVAHPGGAPCNMLAAAVKCGCSAAFIGRVGDDAFGRMLGKTLEDHGIDISCLQYDAERFTTLAFVTLDSDGDRDFSFARKPGADTGLVLTEEAEMKIRDSRVFHFGTLSMTDEPAASATRKAVETAAESGALVSFDPNYRAPLWENEKRAKEAMLWGLERSDIVKISAEEAEMLFGCGPEDAARRILEAGASLVFVTCGARGAYYANRNGNGSVPALAGVRPVDTTGAGDIFDGSAAAMIIKSGKRPDELTVPELERLTAYACAAAGISTERFGGITSVPDKDDIERRIGIHG